MGKDILLNWRILPVGLLVRGGRGLMVASQPAPSTTPGGQGSRGGLPGVL